MEMKGSVLCCNREVTGKASPLPVHAVIYRQILTSTVGLLLKTEKQRNERESITQYNKLGGICIPLHCCLLVLKRKGRRTRSLALVLVHVWVQNEQAKQKFKNKNKPKNLKRMIVLKEVCLCITAYMERA